MNRIIAGKKIGSLTLFGILFLGLLLRLIFLGSKSFYSDEGTTWFIVLGEIFSDAHPPLYFWTVKWFLKILGWSEFAGRLPSVIYGIICIPLFFRIGTKFFGEETGRYAAVLTSFSVFLVLISQEMRMYGLLGLETVLALWFFLNIINEDQPRFKWWLGLFLTSLAGIYTQTLFVFLLFYFGIVILSAPGGKRWRKIGWFALFTLLLIICYLPVIYDILSKTGTRVHIFAASFWHVKVNILRVLKSYFSFIYGNYFLNLPGSFFQYVQSHPWFIVIFTAMLVTWVLMFVFGLLGFVKKYFAGEKRNITVVVLLGMMLYSSILFFFLDVSSPRQMIFIYVPYIFIIASFFTVRKRILKFGILGLWLALNTISLVDYYREPYFEYEKADWRELAGELEKRLLPDDKIFFVMPRNGYYTLKFYLPYIVNEVYYRARPDYPDDKPGHHQLKWGDHQRPAAELVREIALLHPRIWVIGWTSMWYDDEYYRAHYEVEKFNFGPGFELHLYTRKAGLPPAEGSLETF